MIFSSVSQPVFETEAVSLFCSSHVHMKSPKVSELVDQKLHLRILYIELESTQDILETTHNRDQTLEALVAENRPFRHPL